VFKQYESIATYIQDIPVNLSMSKMTSFYKCLFKSKFGCPGGTPEYGYRTWCDKFALGDSVNTLDVTAAAIKVMDVCLYPSTLSFTHWIRR